jgi:NAD(P)-dependent dehydrogenase (short-subunit alcohol dehydrogenase family)
MRAIQDQTVLITGSTDGIGKHTAFNFALLGAEVLLHGRSRRKGESVLEEIKESTGNEKLSFYQADFSSLSEVRKMAEAVNGACDRLDVLINNAGVGLGKSNESQRSLTGDGYELRFGVNYLAPFLLTHLLLDPIRHAAPSRIVNVGSEAQRPVDFDDLMLERHYSSMNAYAQSKLALTMFTFELSERLKNEAVTVNCLHPGSLLNTKMVREWTKPMGTVESGADVVVYIATAPELEGVTGKYFDRKHEARAEPQAYDSEARKRLWRLTEQLTDKYMRSVSPP